MAVVKDDEQFIFDESLLFLLLDLSAAVAILLLFVSSGLDDKGLESNAAGTIITFPLTANKITNQSH
jgi:hypothetical protein